MLNVERVLILTCRHELGVIIGPVLQGSRLRPGQELAQGHISQGVEEPGFNVSGSCGMRRTQMGMGGGKGKGSWGGESQRDPMLGVWGPGGLMQ